MRKKRATTKRSMNQLHESTFSLLTEEPKKRRGAEREREIERRNRITFKYFASKVCGSLLAAIAVFKLHSRQ